MTKRDPEASLENSVVSTKHVSQDNNKKTQQKVAKDSLSVGCSPLITMNPIGKTGEDQQNEKPNLQIKEENVMFYEN